MSDEVDIKGANDMPAMAMSLGKMTYNKTGSWRNMTPVLDGEKCNGCMLCWKFCPDVCMSADDPPIIDYDFCKGCGVCANECPVDAIEMIEGATPPSGGAQPPTEGATPPAEGPQTPEPAATP